jgi:hypothetical protein
MYEYIVKVGCEHAMWMELVDCLRFQNLVVGDETGVFPSKYLVIFYVHVTVHRNKFLCNKTN